MEPDRPALTDARRGGTRSLALQRMLGQCTELLQRELPPLMDAALQRVDDALYDLADKAESDRSYASYFEAQRCLRHQRGNLKRRFLRNLTDTVTLFQDAAQSLDLAVDHSFDSDELQILGERDLEESLVLTNMISKAETRYLRPLRDLTRHFAQLLGRPALRQRDVPVSPTAIANAFAAAVRALDELDISTVLVVHKVFDQQVMDRLEGFYSACVDFARAQGLSPPARKHEIVKNADDDTPAGGRAQSSAGAGPGPTSQPTPAMPSLPISASASQQRPAASGRAGTGAEPVDGAGQNAAQGAASQPADGARAVGDGPLAPSAQQGAASMFEALRQMLAGARQPSAAEESLATLATQELLAVLSRVQPEATQQAADRALAPSTLRHAVGNRLRASMDPSEPRRLAPSDEDTMDLVFLLFEQLLAGADMPDAIKVLVSRLQIPYVKVALVDRRFFDDPEHPARRLLNRIAEASIGWNDGDRDQGDGLYARIEQLVQRVVAAPRSEPRLFETLDRELADYLAGQRVRVASAEERVVRQAVARSSRQNARRQALACIAARVPAPERLPPVVRTVLDDGWVEAMVHAYADGGEQGRAWRSGERVLDDLLWSVEPKRDAAERRELLRRIPELLRDLRACLGTVIADQQLLARWLKELQTVHIAALRGQPDGGLAAGAQRPPRLGVGEDTDTLPTGDADALPIGCWLGVARDDGSIQRFKLAWRGEAGDPVLFVDRLGRKGFELPKPELEALLAQDLATVIGTGDRPLVDRAMEAIRQSLSVH